MDNRIIVCIKICIIKFRLQIKSNYNKILYIKRVFKIMDCSGRRKNRLQKSMISYQILNKELFGNILENENEK